MLFEDFAVAVLCWVVKVSMTSKFRPRIFGWCDQSEEVEYWAVCGVVRVSVDLVVENPGFNSKMNVTEIM